MKTRTILTALAAAFAWPLAGYAASAPVASPSTVPAADFFSFATMNEASISPDGSAVAVLVRNTAGRRQLAVLQTADLTKFKIVASFEDFDVSWARWVDGKSLVFSLGDEGESANEQHGAGLYGIDADGDNMRVLINFNRANMQTGSAIKGRSLDPDRYSFGQVLHDGSGDIVVEHWNVNIKINAYGSEATGMTPIRMNVHTGALTEMGTAWPDHVFQWIIDGQGKVRAGVQNDAGQTTVLAAGPGGTWKQIAQFPEYGSSDASFNMDTVGVDGAVYVTKSVGADGARALFKYDLAAARAEDTPIVSARGFDIDGSLVEDYRDHKVLGVHYDADAEGTAWFDPAMKALQAKVDARLPGLINQIDPADCGCAQRVLVTSHSDRQPNLYFLYDRGDDTLIPFGASRPKINPRQMADTDFVRIKARDGQEIPAYVTKPHGKGPWPTVVLVHGGPWLRGWHWDWDGESQFLASRGYLVVKPEYRGSTGYGYELQSKGNKQWGMKMQDDIADATTWAAQQGLEDPKRTCIMGGSYGGYATLMGLVRYGDLYRCGVAFAAVTDINLMYDVAWSDFGGEYKAYGMPQLVGDQVKDAAQLKATSPIEQAMRITRPLLLAHGGVDRRVPIIHATRLLSALEANHAPVTWIEYKDEGHGWSQPDTRIGFYEDVQKFLDANIGPDAKLTNH